MLSLGECVDILDSRRVPINGEERARRVGDIPYYGATGQVGWIDSHLFDEDLVLLGEDGAPFLDRTKPKAYMVRGKSWVNNHAHVLRGKPGLLNEFLLYQLNHIDYRAFVSGTTRLKLPQGPMKQIKLWVPPLDDQRRIIAEIEKQFTRLDSGVAALRRVRANLKRYRAAVLKAACEGRLVPTEAELARREGREGDFETGQALLARILAERSTSWSGRGRYKTASNTISPGLPPLPEGWTWTSIDSLIREPLRNGASTTPSRSGTGLRVFTLTAVTTGDFSERNTKLSATGTDKIADLWAEPGEIYVERGNTPELVGTARLYVGPRNFAFIPDLFIRIRLTHIVSPRYVETCLLSERARDFFRSRAQGIAGSMPKIDQNTVASLPIPLPPSSEQQRIAAEVERQLSIVEELATVVVTGFQRVAHLRHSILRSAFGGNLT